MQNSIQVLSAKAIHGPNLFHRKPVLITKIDLGKWTEVASTDIEGFTEKLVSILPGLEEHRCSPGRRGGFIERLHRGTYFAHIIEHVALELSTPVGIDVGFGKSVYAGKEGHYEIITRFKNEAAMKYLVKEAVGLVEKVATGRDVDVEAIIAHARDLKSETELGPSSMAIVQAAEKRDIPWRRLGTGSLIELGYGIHRRRVQTAVTNSTGLIATELVQDKDATKELLKQASIPVPYGFVASSSEDVTSQLNDLSFPVVVKPFDGHHGQGVFMNLNSLKDVLEACHKAWEYSSQAIVEEQCFGQDYRVLVINGKMVAASERKPAQVTGDGVSTIEELVEKANQNPMRGEGHSNVLTKIPLDEEVISFLAGQNKTKESIPTWGEVVKLVQVANLSQGGTARDVTDEVHESVRSMCERAARLTDLDICGIDLIHPDISKPAHLGARIIEVNAGPGLRMHIAPSEGKARDVGGAIVDMLYPTGSGRIPIVAITGTNGKTTTARLTAHIAGVGKKTVGLTCSDGIMINGKYISKGDTTGPVSARTILHDPSVELAVLETARGGLMRNGLGYDWSDVGVITNISPDHFGQDGIEDLDDLIRVKALVAERVKPGGTLVLNADNPQSRNLPKLADLNMDGRKIVYYSTEEDSEFLKDHSENQKGRSIGIKNGWVCEFENGHESRLIRVQEIRFALGGRSPFNLSNALAATAAARSIGIPQEQVSWGLQSFESHGSNAGRMNFFEVNGGLVILDYAHNPEAIAAIGKMVKGWGIENASCIVGLPGDRADGLLKDCARVLAENFSSITLRDELDLRGRPEGATPELIQSTIRKEYPNLECSIAPRAQSFGRLAAKKASEAQVTVLLCDEYKDVAQELKKYDAVDLEDPVQLLPSLKGSVKKAVKPEVRTVM